MIRVVVADDHAVMREGLVMLLETRAEMQVVAQAENGEQAVERAIRQRADVVLMDISMPVLDGVAATRLLYDRAPDVAVVILTTFADSKKVMASLEAGAVGYLMKDSAAADVIAGVVAAANGGSPLDPRVARSLVEAQRRDPAPQNDVTLTVKQGEVLSLVAEGLSNRLIARQMGISEKTVKTHLTTIYALLGVTDRVQAAVWAQRHLPTLGWSRPSDC
ncbi:MAG: response regulator transcription factor [Candidatus Nanopelagicales bacterium]